MTRRTRSILVLAMAMCLATVACGAGPATSSPPSPAPSTSPAASTTRAPTASTTSAPTASPPPQVRPALAGETTPIHDPALIVDRGISYVFSTGRVQRENGGTIQIWSSKDRGKTWTSGGTVWDKIPGWIDKRYAGGALSDNLWAPEIHKEKGIFYLYYSASRFGTDDSVTALATNTTLDPQDPDYRWVDRGAVISSPVTGLDPKDPALTFNAIDAGIVEDKQGRPFMSIGSFWSGIFLVPLEWPSGKPVAGWKTKTVHLAQRQVEGDPIEASYIVRHGGFYYLFVSFDLCCRGADSTYKIAVGRSKSLAGEYLDRKGTRMLAGGGTVILETKGDVVGPGGQSVFGDTLAFHYYDAANSYVPTLGLRKIEWSSGWPAVG